MAIGDNDIPVISFDPSSYRYDEGYGTLTFTLTLSEASEDTVRVSFGTLNGSAMGGSVDYRTKFSTIDFTAGSTTATGSVSIVHDTLTEGDEFFFVSLFNQIGATFGGRNHALSAPVFILDNDTGGDESALAVSGPVAVEGSGVASFEISLSQAFDVTTTLRYETVSDSAEADNDFVATSGAITFEAGQTSATVDVGIVNGVRAEAAEHFGLAVTGAGLAAFGQATLLDDDGSPTISIENSRVVEQYGTEYFTVRLSQETDSAVTVQYRTVSGSAYSSDGDYGSDLSTIRFEPGQTTARIAVSVDHDNLSEDDENFFVELSNPVGAGFGGRNESLRATGWILDNDAEGGATAIAVSAPVVNEGSGVATFTVSLSEASDEEQSFDFTTVSGSARRGDDFASTSGTLDFRAGQTEATVSVDLENDSVAEATEVFGLRVTGAEIGNTGWAKIVDTDGSLPIVSVESSRIYEGNSNARFAVRLSEAATTAVTVDVTTHDGTALGSSDYDAQTSTATFAAGQTVAWVDVGVDHDTTSENDESFFVTLSNPTGAAFDDADQTPTATGFILDDDTGAEKRVISVSGTTVSEAAANGEAQAVFTIQLSRAFDEDVVIDYETANGTAKSSSDYVATDGSIRIGAGATEAYVTVDVLNNLASERDETFSLRLSDLPDDLAPSGNVTRGTATITDGAIAGTASGDRLSGTRYADRIEGLGGNDRISGGGGDDALFGGAGTDTLTGGAGDDTLSGGRGADRMSGGEGDDVYSVDNSRDRVTELGREGADEIRSSVSFKLPNFVETLKLTGGKDISATGNGRANTLIGNSGDNTLNGGGGQDTLTGGGGDDTFLFRSREAAGMSSSRDHITDFDRGDDVIDLHFIDANTGRSGNQSFDFIGSHGYSETAGELRYANGILAGDVDGDGRSDFQIGLGEDVARLAAGDFVL